MADIRWFLIPITGNYLIKFEIFSKKSMPNLFYYFFHLILNSFFISIVRVK